MSPLVDLVTGATGFIGSHLTERLLREGRAVRVLCREASVRRLPAGAGPSLDVVVGDLRDPASLRAATAGVARVFHCAGHVLDWGAKEDFEATNVRGTASLLEAAAAADVRRFVHFSSIAVFGTPSPPYFDDDSGFGEGRDLYTRTKIEGENVARRFSSTDGGAMDVVVLRPAVVYGPRGTWLEEPLAMLEQGKLFLLGGGSGTCHPCYIENLIDATLLAADHPRARGRAYIVGDDSPRSFRDYFDGIAAIAGRAPVRRSIPLPVARAAASALELGAHAIGSQTRPLLTRTALDMVTTKSTMSMERIKTELGFRPRYDFEGAVRELRAWYQATRASGAPGSPSATTPPPP